MDVPLWWIWIAATVGLCIGMGLFAVLAMAADPEVEGFADAQAPTQTPI